MRGSKQTSERTLRRSTPAAAFEWTLAPGELPPPAAHVVTRRIGYTHHGIHVGGGRVIHYSGFSRGWRGGPVEEVSLLEFAAGHPISVRVHDAPAFGRDGVIARARSRLGEDRYRALTNNCEHLCTWCIEGVSHSRQVESWRVRWQKGVGALRGVMRTRRSTQRAAPVRPAYDLVQEPHHA